MSKSCLSFLTCFLFFASFGQSGQDSGLQKIDSTRPNQARGADSLRSTVARSSDSAKGLIDSQASEPVDSTKRLPPVPEFPPALTLFHDALAHNPWFNFLGTPESNYTEEHRQRSDDGLFYLLVGMILFFACMRLFFSRYLNNLVSLLFRASMRQQSLREQLSQTPFPSLLLNLLFTLSAGLYITFLAVHYKLGSDINFWLLLVDCCVLTGILYLIKFLVLKTTGWIFNISKATDAYIFIVYMLNKILGILLIPVLILLFFSDPYVQDVALVVSFFLWGLMFFYRFIAAYPTIRNEIKISILYFFLYLCAFEIAPLLLIYKVLLSFVGKPS